MIQAQQQINLYHTLFLICMTVFLIGIVLTVVLFVLLDIRRIFGIKTGRSVKKKVREMAEENEKESVHSSSSSANMEYQGSEDTSVLQNQQMTEGSADTALLQNYISETQNASNDRGDTDQTYGRFVIVKSIVIIHTNEVV